MDLDDVFNRKEKQPKVLKKNKDKPLKIIKQKKVSSNSYGDSDSYVETP